MDRDQRPQFATLRSSVNDDLERDDWANVLRDRMGLAHFTNDDPIALMSYPVKQVYNHTGLPNPITMPTVLDSTPWPHYFPAPAALRFGRAMALSPCEDDANLLVELLNAKINYKPNHILKLGQFSKMDSVSDIAYLRELHLLALRIAANDENFGS